MQMKRDPVNGLLICLVRLCEEVSPAPQTERCPFWTHITHVTASLHSTPQNTPHTILSLTPTSVQRLFFMHSQSEANLGKKKNLTRGNQ